MKTLEMVILSICVALGTALNILTIGGIIDINHLIIRAIMGVVFVIIAKEGIKELYENYKIKRNQINGEVK